MKKLARLSAVLTLALPFVAAAEPPSRTAEPPSRTAAPLPKPVADMQCLVGQWKGGGSLTMGQDSAKIAATWSCKRTSAQYGVLCNFRVTGIPGVQLYEETDLMGYEPNTNTYHWYAVTNAGETHDHVASPAAGDTLQFVFTGTQEGKPFKEVIDLTLPTEQKQMSGRAETFVGGASVSVMQLALRQ